LPEQREIPVFLFTGFLDSGKTRFIQETLEDRRFCNGERTLLVVCEEGEEEYAPDQFADASVFIRTVEGEADLRKEKLLDWQKETNAERVVIEYNGMWMLDSLYAQMPQNWMVYQEFMFAYSATFLSYNTNMRQLVYDKLKSCELVVFNRFDPKQDILPFHKVVRGANRSCDIAYEDESGKVRYDDIEDPLPFDKNAKVIEIADRDYAIWYRDLSEELKSYDGKTVCFKAQVAKSEELDADTIIVGRQLMNCCAADITFTGLIAEKNPRRELDSGDWVELTASIRVRKHPGYNRVGPVLTIREISAAEPPEEEVATFY
jgi:G3E family GTPase